MPDDRYKRDKRDERAYARYKQAQVNFSAYLLAAGLLLVLIVFIFSLFT